MKKRFDKGLDLFIEDCKKGTKWAKCTIKSGRSVYGRGYRFTGNHLSERQRYEIQMQSHSKEKWRLWHSDAICREDGLNRVRDLRGPVPRATR